MDNIASTDEICRVFNGDLNNLPAKESHLVRIFLSSTFTDYAEERNLIHREAIPELRKHCHARNLDLQIADMRWGVRDDAQDDHQTTRIVLREVETCQRLSMGPNFVAMLGNRYGSRSFPSEIEASEFNLLVNAAFTISKDHQLFEKWYKLDENAIPHTYILQPITAHFPFYNDETEANNKKREKDRKQWSLVYDLLTSLFRQAAQHCYKTGHFTYEQRQKYYVSVTEAEVQKGIIQVEEGVNNAALCFTRNLTDIDINNALAKRFVDIEAGQVDEEAQELLHDLRDNQVRHVLNEDNMFEETLAWDEKGVNPDDFDHLRYLNFFKNAFLRLVGGLIYKAMQRRKIMNTNKELYTEVLQHSHQTLAKSKNFLGRTETLNRIKFKLNKIYFWEAPKSDPKKAESAKPLSLDEYMQGMEDDVEKEKDEHHKEFHGMYNAQTLEQLNLTGAAHELDNDLDLKTELAAEITTHRLKQYSKPLIVHGQSGAGKTAMMAQIAKLSEHWFTAAPVRVVRYCGTTPMSSSIGEVIASICSQIRQAYNVPGPSMSNMRTDFGYLLEYFKSLLMSVGTEEKPLVVLIDSIDQLSILNNPCAMRWLPRKLKPNVYLIVSFIPTHLNLLENCKTVLPDEDRYMEVPSLPKDTGASIIKVWLKDANRKLSTEQTEVILAKLRMCPQPLFLKLCFEQARHWHSYTQRSEWNLGITVRSVIEQMFIRLEVDHGTVLVAKALSYMTIGKNGVTDTEMEDLLSLEDEVLQDTYLYHLPPDPHLVRIPPLMWARLKADIGEYLVEYQVGIKTITRWYHRQFEETVDKRYFTPAQKTLLHSNMVDYYTGKWANQVKPITFSKKKYGVYNEAMRGVPEQPCVFEKNAFNYRRLSELPYHLTQCRRHVDFITYVCYDFNFLFYKCKAVSVQELLHDLHQQKRVLEEEIQVILDREEEERKRRERERRKRKAPDMEAGKSAVLITDVTDDLDEEEYIENREDEEETLPEKTPIDTANLDIFQLTSIQPLNLTELRECLMDLQYVMDMLVLGFDSIVKDPDHFVGQVLGQVSENDPCSEGFADIRAKARAYVLDTNTALLAPVSKCMPSPGEELITSFDIMIGFPGDNYETESKVALTKDARKLYIVERNSNSNKACKNNKNEMSTSGDFLRIHELSTSGFSVSLEPLIGFDVKKMKLMGGDRYLYFEVYQKKSRDSYFTCVLDIKTHLPLPFAPDSKVLAFSSSGRYCLVVEPYYRSDKKMTSLSKENTENDILAPSPGNEIATQTGTDHVDDEITSLQIAQLHDIETGQKTSLNVMALTSMNYKVTSGVFSPDEKFVICHSNEGLTFALLVERGKFMYKWGEQEQMSFNFGGDKAVQSTVLPKNYLLQSGISYKDSNTLYVRNLNNGETIRELKCGNYAVNHLLINDSSALAATASSVTGYSSDKGRNKDIYVWDLDKGDLVSQCVCMQAVSALCFIGEQDEFLLVCPRFTCVTQVWYIGTIKNRCPSGILIHNLIGHSDEVLSLDYSKTMQNLVTSSKDNTIKIWSVSRILTRCEEILKLAGKGMDQNMDNLREALKPETGVKPCDPSKNPTKTTSLAFAKDNKLAAIGTSGGWVIIMDTEVQEPVYQHYCAVKDKDSSVSAILASSDGKYFISGGRAQNINLFDAQTGEHVRCIESKKPVQCMAENAGVLVCGQGGMECFGVCYDLSTGKVLATLQGLYGFSTVAITSDGKRVVTTFFDFPMIFSVETGELADGMQQPDTMMAGCTCLRLCPKDRLVAACSSDGSVKVLEMATGAYKFRMQHKSSVVAAAFDQNSTSLVTAGFRNILVWNMRTGALSHSLQRHNNFITDLQFSACGRFLLSASLDKQIIIWDYELGASIATYMAHCPLRYFAVASDLSAIMYAPENVKYAAIIRPNAALAAILKGEETNQVSKPMMQAQAFAFAFSGQRAKEKSSRACVIL